MGHGPRFNNQLDGSSHFIFDGYLREFRHEAYMDPIEPEIAGCYNKSLHGLVDRPRANSLKFRPVMFADHARNSASYSRCP